MIPDYPGALVIANNNYFPNRNGYKPKFIILHGTAGGTSAQAIANYFASTQGGSNPVSSHYVIGQDGTIVQCVAEANGAWGNGGFSKGHDAFWDESVNPNLTTISIEHCKPSTDNHDVLTSEQFDSSKKLVADICQRHGINARYATDASGGITGHYSLDPINRSNCPGPYPWDELLAYLKGGETLILQLTDPGVSRYFRDGGGGTWRCSNGVSFIGANLAFYRANNGLALFGLPLHNEIYPSAYPGTAVVPCERALIVYDPSRKIDNPPISGQCYLLHIDSGIGQQLLTQIAVQKATAEYQATIQNLQAQLVEAKNATPVLDDYKSRFTKIKEIVSGV